MKIAIITLLLTVSSAVLWSEERSCSLSLSIQELRNDRGRLYVAIFDTPSRNFPDSTKAIRILKIKPSGNTGDVKLALKCGKYALAIFHDENDNTLQDKNMLGLPIEGYGFSGTSRSHIGPPEYEMAEFELKEADQPLVIKLIYLF